VLNGAANAPNSFIGGGGGNDTMNGDAGTATNFYYVDGNDQVNGAGAFDTMIDLLSGVIVQLGSGQYQGVQEFVTAGGTNVVTVVNGDSDFIYLYAVTGNDTLTTGSDGGHIDNNSTVHGASTFNTAVELQQNISLTLGSAQLGTDVQEVVLNGGTNTVDFSSATSSVYLYGGSGNDTLIGGTGNDFLYGEGGTNTFGFQAGWGMDTIMDWTSGTNNQIDLTALAGLGVHAVTDLTQTITNGNDVITSGHTGTNGITLMGVGRALAAGSFYFA
jgi:hypothetical protein